MKDWHPVRFHLTDAELKESDEALEDVGGKRGTYAKKVYMKCIREMNAARRAEKAEKKR